LYLRQSEFYFWLDFGLKREATRNSQPLLRILNIPRFPVS
jgi:hypothetical protein